MSYPEEFTVPCHLWLLKLQIITFIFLPHGYCAITWWPWPPQPGKFLGAGNGMLPWINVSAACAEEGTIQPVGDVHVDFQSADFLAFMQEHFSSGMWYTGNQTTGLTGQCQGVTVQLVSGSAVQETALDCPWPVNYICYGTPYSETTIAPSTIEQTTEAATTVPETTEAATTQPITTEPETTQPITTEPETTQPITTESETTQPITTESETAQPTTTQPITPESESTQHISTTKLQSTDTFHDSTTTTAGIQTSTHSVTGTSNANSPTDLTTGLLGLTTSSNFIPITNFTELSWNAWTPWSICTVSCNGGQKLRLRLCAGELECRIKLASLSNVTISYDMEWAVCNAHACPIDGIWMTWALWGVCSATCDTGTRRRVRQCDGPFHDGDGCVGEKQQTEFCQDEPCPAKVKVVPPEEDSFKESDGRPSAIGVGVVSLAFVLVELAIVLLLDSLTIVQHCQKGCLKHHNHHHEQHEEDESDDHVDEVVMGPRRQSEVFGIPPPPTRKVSIISIYSMQAASKAIDVREYEDITEDKGEHT